MQSSWSGNPFLDFQNSGGFASQPSGPRPDPPRAASPLSKPPQQPPHSPAEPSPGQQPGQSRAEGRPDPQASGSNAHWPGLAPPGNDGLPSAEQSWASWEPEPQPRRQSGQSPAPSFTVQQSWAKGLLCMDCRHGLLHASFMLPGSQYPVPARAGLALCRCRYANQLRRAQLSWQMPCRASEGGHQGFGWPGRQLGQLLCPPAGPCSGACRLQLKCARSLLPLPSHTDQMHAWLEQCPDHMQGSKCCGPDVVLPPASVQVCRCRVSTRDPLCQSQQASLKAVYRSQLGVQEAAAQSPGLPWMTGRQASQHGPPQQDPCTRSIWGLLTALPAWTIAVPEAEGTLSALTPMQVREAVLQLAPV